jgi:hypothetical protein
MLSVPQTIKNTRHDHAKMFLPLSNIFGVLQKLYFLYIVSFLINFTVHVRISAGPGDRDV